MSAEKANTQATKTDNIEKEILTADEAANHLRIKKKTLQNYVSERKLKSVKGGKFRRRDLEEFLEHKKKK